MLKSVLLLFLSATTLIAQQSLLQSGPMVGYSEMKEVMLWVQTKKAAKVKIGYWEKEKTATKYFTKEVLTAEEKAFSTKLLADQVLPGRKYAYEVYINSKRLSFDYPLEFQSLVLYQTRFDAPDFTFALGSCAYVNDSADDRSGKPFGGGYEIFPSIHAKKPDFMMWLGDMTYLREPDWNSRTGIYYRYTHTRSLPELQPLLANTHHYGIWDDHDYGPNDHDRGFWNKTLTEEAFNTFWCNPNTNLTQKGGITGTFQWNDVQFFLLDDRWFRSPFNRKGERVFLGAEQIDWLLDALSTSNATFKFICIGSQVLNPLAVKENYANYPIEFQTLLQGIEDSKINGVVFLSGDRHFTEITKLPRSKSYPLYDFTISPLLSRVYTGEEPNYLREPGTRVSEKNFGIIRVTGPKNERKLVLTIFNANGNELWSKEVFAKELK